MFKQILQSRWFTFGMIIVVGFLALSVVKILPAVVAVNKEAKNLEQKINETNRNFAELERSKEYLKSPAYLERQARIKLNFKKPDEKVVFVYQKPYSLNPTASTAAENDYKSWWRNWLKWLQEKLSRV